MYKKVISLRNGRITAFLIILVLIIFFYPGFIFTGSVDSRDQKPRQEEVQVLYYSIRVQEGDSLWRLVKEFSSQGKDPRLMVYETLRLNELESPLLYPGQVILVPR